MLDAASYPVLRIAAVPVMPVDKMVLGKTVEEAAELLPRLFNLCRNAQSLAARRRSVCRLNRIGGLL